MVVSKKNVNFFSKLRILSSSLAVVTIESVKVATYEQVIVTNRLKNKNIFTQLSGMKKRDVE